MCFNNNWSGIAAALVVVIPAGDVALIVVTLEGDKRKRWLVSGSVPKHHNKGVLPELLMGARVSGVAPAGGVREERRKQSKGKRISRAVTGKATQWHTYTLLRMAHGEEIVVFAEK